MEGTDEIVTKKYIIIFLIVLSVLALYNNVTWLMKYMYPLKYAGEIQKCSKEFAVDPYLIAAIIKVESGYKPDVISKKGARGLMQLMPDTAKWIAENMKMENFDVKMLEEPGLNIKMGTWYFSSLLKEFDNDTTLALAAYNGGRGNVAQWIKSGCFADGTGDKIPFEETKGFIKKVRKAHRWYKRLYSF